MPRKEKEESKLGVGLVICLLCFFFCCCLHFFTLGFSTYWMSDKWVDAKPYEHDVQIGKKYFNQVQKQGIVYPGDQPMQKLVSKTCQDLVKNVDPSFRDAVPFTFNVIRRDDSNAFSVPGGFIFFHDDLLDEPMNATKDEIAAVCAHEIGHVVLRHGQKQASYSWISSPFMDMVVFLSKFDPTGISHYILTGILNLINLSYQRSHENEADKYAVELLRRTNYPVEGMISFFEKLMATETLKGKDNDFSEWTRTHPLSRNRIANIQMLMNPVDGGWKIFSFSFFVFLIGCLCCVYAGNKMHKNSERTKGSLVAGFTGRPNVDHMA